MENLSVLSFKSLFDNLTIEQQEAFRAKIMKPEINICTHADILCRYIYTSYFLDHLVYKGQKYETWNTSWDESDSKVYCNGYWTDECRIGCEECLPNFKCEICIEEELCKHFTCEHIKKIVPTEDVEYIMRYDIIHDSFDNESQIAFVEFLDTNRHEIIINASDEAINFTTLVVENLSGENLDHSGSTHCKLDNLYESEVELTLPCTLDQLAQALFKIKSHKWDKWYELFTGAEIGFSSTDTGIIDLCIQFDHGS